MHQGEEHPRPNPAALAGADHGPVQILPGLLILAGPVEGRPERIQVARLVGLAIDGYPGQLNDAVEVWHAIGKQHGQGDNYIG
jgi:hypothetical protein